MPHIQDHTTGHQQSWDLNPGSLAYIAHALNYSLSGLPSMASVIVIFHVNPMLWQEEFFQAGPLSQSGTFFFPI